MNWSSAEEQLLAVCARIDFDVQEREQAQDLCRQNQIDWKRVYKTARTHGVAPLVYHNLGGLDPVDLGMEKSSANRFRRSFARNLTRRWKSQAILLRILSILNEQDLTVMLVKGGALDLLGAGSGPYTVSRDIDLIVHAGRDQLTDELLVEIQELSQRFPLELGYGSHHDLTMNGALCIDFDQIWADAIPIHYKGRDFFIMSPEDALITACVNACRKRYFNLNALCAIDALIRGTPMFRWKELGEKCRDYEVKDIVYTALLVAERMMHSPLPEDLAERLATFKAPLLELIAKRLSLSSLSSLYEGMDIAGRKVGASLLLPYVSYRGHQIRRKVMFALANTEPRAIPDKIKPKPAALSASH